MSARVGRNILLVQGAGGNSSVKDGDVLWVKASGTWLADAESEEIMVPVERAPGSADAFRVPHWHESGLRPSIETSMHAALPQAVVLHVHSVDAIALAVRSDAVAQLGQRLGGLRWAFVPYVRPGLPLARAIADAAPGGGADILVLGNHGLVVAAEGVAAAELLLAEVVNRLAVQPRAAPPSSPVSRADALQGPGFRPCADSEIHALAIDPVSFTIATGGVLYPDHVVFLGRDPLVVGPDETLAAALSRRSAAGQAAPKWAIVKGIGVAIADDVARGGAEMLRCLADVAARIPRGAALSFLGEAEIAELTDWDAEKYRQKVARAAA
jgi:rhamnose utilization protein RhaD (predicted bifunctional aldolase and dehydrogenase)